MFESMVAVVMDVPEVVDIDHLHLWNLASDVSACSADVVLSATPSLRHAQQIAEQVKAHLADRFGLVHVTLELESRDPTSPPGTGQTTKSMSAPKEQQFT